MRLCVPPYLSTCRGVSFFLVLVKLLYVQYAYNRFLYFKLVNFSIE